MNADGFYSCLGYRWAKADPRLLWNPSEEIRKVLRCISRRRPLRREEAEHIVTDRLRAMGKEYASGVIRRYVFYWWCPWGPHDFLWRGSMVYVRRVDWQDLEQEARAEHRQFCLIDQHRREHQMRLWRREAELHEITRLTNRLKKGITDARRARKAGQNDSERSGHVSARDSQRTQWRAEGVDGGNRGRGDGAGRGEGSGADERDHAHRA